MRSYIYIRPRLNSGVGNSSQRLMKRRFQYAACLGFGFVFTRSLGAQRAQVGAPSVPRCYRLAQGEWSRPLGVNARYHTLPVMVRLDTARAGREGWKVAPDIDFPTPSHFRGTPRWTRQGESIEMLWSNGYQVTTVRLSPSGGDELRGTAIVRSDANEFGSDLPHASIVARRISCAARQ
jgi:hypothetical protein